MINSENPGGSAVKTALETAVENAFEDGAGTELSTERFAFHGNGADYFRIWIVNMLFTILTLGIYSAWAKVRTKRYFYGNTELAGDRFEYLASPIAILKGRLIAVAALLVYSLAGLVSVTVGWLAFALLLLLIPLAVVQSRRFNASNSAWRGVRFGFDGGHQQAYPPHFFWPIFGFATLGLLLPVAWHKANHFQYNHYRFGTTRSRSTTDLSDFYIIGLSILIAAIVIFVLYFLYIFLVGMLSAMIGTGDSQLATDLGFALVFFPSLVFFYASLVAFYQSMFYKLVFNSIEVGNNSFRNSIKSYNYVLLILSNTFLTILTLGFFHPWAAVRRARYLLSNIQLEARDLDSFAAGELDHASARGEEFGEAFDLGLGL